MKYILLFLFLVPLCAIAQSHSQYLVTKKGDTVFYKGDLIVDNDQIIKWRSITADSAEYAIDEIKCAFFDNHFYYNCDGRRLYKQVVKGHINVYALNEKDTITDRKGNLTKKVFIQHDTDRKPVVYTRKNLIHMISDNEEITLEQKDLNAKTNGGKAMIISGVSIGVPTVVIGLFGAFITAIFGDDTSANQFLAVAGAGVAVGTGLLVGGSVMKAGTSGLNLLPVHAYNANK